MVVHLSIFEMYHKKTAEIILKLLVIHILTTRVFTNDCSKNQFRSSFTDDCSNCPENPSINCGNEGFDQGACEEKCVIINNEGTSSSSNKIGVAIGISIGVLSLVTIIVGLGLCWHRKRKKSTNGNAEDLNHEPREYEPRQAEENTEQILALTGQDSVTLPEASYTLDKG
ncbi:uncharacterized protein LOC114538296 [Dendronephthya gigantea]|uniref:uncharacterized protein LOC114538296 n=1 Tax=Dendronephthya gigantea TaxID=151771 RepID=UPI001069A0DB|nr:uncharacterized protein LOC114538296 [Dendronephthya gigantea]